MNQARAPELHSECGTVLPPGGLHLYLLCFQERTESLLDSEGDGSVV